MPIDSVSNKSYLQTPDQIAYIVDKADESHKQAYVDKKGRVQIRGKLGDLVFNIRKAFKGEKGEEWAKSESARNTRLILNAFTNALVRKEEGRFTSPADKEYISNKIRGWLDNHARPNLLAIPGGPKSRPTVRLLERQIAANQLPQARIFRQVAKQVADASLKKVGRHNQKALDIDVQRLSNSRFAEYREKLDSVSRNRFPSPQRHNALIQELETKAKEFDARIPELQSEVASLKDRLSTLHTSLPYPADPEKERTELAKLTSKLEKSTELLEHYESASDTFHRAIEGGKSARAAFEAQQTANASGVSAAQLPSSESDIENAKEIYSRISALGALHYADNAVDIINASLEFTPDELAAANDLLLGGYDLDVLYDKPELLQEGEDAYKEHTFAGAYAVAYKPYGERAAEGLKSRLVAGYNDFHGTKLRFDRLPEKVRAEFEDTVQPARELGKKHAPKIWANLPLIRKVINTAKAHNLDKDSAKLLIRRVKGQDLDPRYRATKYRGIWGAVRPDGHKLFEILNRVEQSAKSGKGTPSVGISDADKDLVNSLVPVSEG